MCDHQEALSYPEGGVGQAHDLLLPLVIHGLTLHDPASSRYPAIPLSEWLAAYDTPGYGDKEAR